MSDELFVSEHNDKFYLTSKAHIVASPEELPREMASSAMRGMNPSFVWIAGRYVQANSTNLNGHYWTADDLNAGMGSIQFTPLNSQHDWAKPVGTIVEAKMVERANSSGPEIQALSVLWSANFPELAAEVRRYHEHGQLWYSMECVAESKQCLTCEETYPWATAAADMCEHLSTNGRAPRRFVNPTFLGGALVYPPESPAWRDADITEVAKHVGDYANRVVRDLSVSEWERLMGNVSAF